jgi:glycosyltransferase involved in cell wall biosynthesis
MITTFYPPYNFGGDGIFVQQLSNELAARGHHVEVIHCLDAYRAMRGRRPKGTLNDHPNVIVHRLSSRFGFLSPLATQQLGAPFFKSEEIKRILARGFDVIHFHNVSLVGGPRLLKYGRGIKLYTTHEFWLVCPTHVLFKFNRAPCQRPRCFACTLFYARPPQFWRYTDALRRAVKDVDAFIAPSRFSIEKHREFGFDGPMVHLPHFVPPPRETWRAESDAPYFLYVGRLEKIKGLHTLIAVFRNYHKANLLIAGRGSDERHLRQLAQGCDHIRFLGYLSGEEVSALYRGATALLMPSIVLEMFGLVLIEALSHATPVIARNQVAMAEVVRESGGGFLYDSDESLVAAMDQLLANRALREELGARGYAAYQREWTPAVHLQRYFELIERIAREK